MTHTHDNTFSIYPLLVSSFEFYKQFGWSKAKTYKHIKDAMLDYKNIKYIQNLKHGSRVHFK